MVDILAYLLGDEVPGAGGGRRLAARVEYGQNLRRCLLAVRQDLQQKYRYGIFHIYYRTEVRTATGT